VSSDLNHDPHSCTILLDQTKVIDGNFVNIMGWYDNEWGFSNRMVDVTPRPSKQTALQIIRPSPRWRRPFC
jgi:glyceraldehyde-3-phosphate dehydrogenase/erythrose-4-phosphate dehydrogenase